MKMSWIFEFGFWGCWEIVAGLLVSVGCAGELWIILNKLTKHIEPNGKNISRVWRFLNWADAKTRPIWVSLKTKGRKLSEAKEGLLERLFVMLVAAGVTMEVIGAVASLHEIAKVKLEAAKANEQAGTANELAAKANEQAGEANERAAKADESAAAANVRASSNELARAETEREIAKMEITLANIAIDLRNIETNTDIGQMASQVEAVKKMAAAALSTATAAAQDTGSRHLTEAQKNSLSLQMAQFAPVGFEFQIDPQANSSEAQIFGNDIANALVAAGWKYKGVAANVMAINDGSGLAISANPETPGIALRNALIHMDFEAHLEPLTIRNSENDVTIRIEPKPMIRVISK
jgi:hypothetical protein